MAKLSSTQIFGNLVVDGEILNKATTTTEGVVKLNDATNSTSTTQAATANAVKKAYDLAAGKAASSHTHNYAGSSSAGGAATSATKLATARTLTIGSTGKTFDGSANVSWSLAEIGVGALTGLQTTTKTSIVAAINEVFQSVSSGKSSIAQAITSKGVSASSSDTFTTLSTKLKKLYGVGDTISLSNLEAVQSVNNNYTKAETTSNSSYYIYVSTRLEYYRIRYSGGNTYYVRLTSDGSLDGSETTLSGTYKIAENINFSDRLVLYNTSRIYSIFNGRSDYKNSGGNKVYVGVDYVDSSKRNFLLIDDGLNYIVAAYDSNVQTNLIAFCSLSSNIGQFLIKETSAWAITRYEVVSYIGEKIVLSCSYESVGGAPVPSDSLLALQVDVDYSDYYMAMITFMSSGFSPETVKYLIFYGDRVLYLANDNYSAIYYDMYDQNNTMITLQEDYYNYDIAYASSIYGMDPNRGYIYYKESGNTVAYNFNSQSIVTQTYNSLYSEPSYLSFFRTFTYLSNSSDSAMIKFTRSTGAVTGYKVKATM